MKTDFHVEIESITFSCSESSNPLKEKENCIVSHKFYQKSFILLISLATILIFPESPKELENICETYNSRHLCNVW